ncbi:hypothetical protein GCM10009754_28670 [Amycolatopsis minnesotensis]|uniref:HTH tetR-type domain-containing protein n=1 Tax=Amycolatopsis minnesotensis TaxID=337894 RepID=A0ABN2QR16_9PSEU
MRETGVDGLSLREIARDVGVSNGAPRRHFSGKQALLDALAVEGFHRLGAEFQAADLPDGSLRDRLHALAQAYMRFAVANSSLLTLMFARKHSSGSGADFTGAVAGAFALPLGVIADAQQRGEVVAGAPERIGLSAAAALQGLITFVGTGFVSRENAEELLRETIDLLIQGLKPRD